MAETLGSAIDKLIVVSMKLWQVQDALFKARAAGTGLDAKTTERLCDLNLQRNQLMTEVDRIFAAGVETGHVVVDPRHKLT